MLSVDVRSVKDCLIAPARRLDIEKHLRDLGMTLPIIKIGLVFVSGDLKHDTEGVINFNDIMDGWVDVNLDCGAFCDCGDHCSPETNGCSCAGPENPTCTRIHFAASDGAPTQFKNKYLHRDTSCQLASGRRRRQWMIKCPAHGKDDVDPLLGWVKQLVASLNQHCGEGNMQAVSNVQEIVDLLKAGHVLPAIDFLKKSSSQSLVMRQFFLVPAPPRRARAQVILPAEFRLAERYSLCDTGIEGQLLVRNRVCKPCLDCLLGNYHKCRVGISGQDAEGDKLRYGLYQKRTLPAKGGGVPSRFSASAGKALISKMSPAAAGVAKGSWAVFTSQSVSQSGFYL